jgi:hypothetical protein
MIHDGNIFQNLRFSSPSRQLLNIKTGQPGGAEDKGETEAAARCNYWWPDRNIG